MDSRLKLISNSSLCLLHTCPRKYQLIKIAEEVSREETIHTQFGKALGEGIQALLAGDSLEDATLKALMMWTWDLEERDKSKSIWNVISALENFTKVRYLTGLDQYEVARFQGKPACELGFKIKLPRGFYYRGWVDVILKHKITGSYLVVDIKTTGAKYSNPAKYQNSPQAIGYSIILDQMDSDYSQYDVMYFEYLTELKKFVEHVFVVGHLQRAQWLRNLMVDQTIMELYNSYEEWPMHGESCTAYNRACQFLDTCTMSTKSLTSGKVVEGDIDEGIEYDVVVSFEELIKNQLERV